MISGYQVLSSSAQLVNERGQIFKGTAILYEEHEMSSGRGGRSGTFWFSVQDEQHQILQGSRLSLAFVDGPELEIFVKNQSIQLGEGSLPRVEFVDTRLIRD